MPHCRGGIRLEYIRRIFPPSPLYSPAIPFSREESPFRRTGTCGRFLSKEEGRKGKGRERGRSR